MLYEEVAEGVPSSPIIFHNTLVAIANPPEQGIASRVKNTSTTLCMEVRLFFLLHKANNKNRSSLPECVIRREVLPLLLPFHKGCVVLYLIQEAAPMSTVGTLEQLKGTYGGTIGGE